MAQYKGDTEAQPGLSLSFLRNLPASGDTSSWATSCISAFSAVFPLVGLLVSMQPSVAVIVAQAGPVFALLRGCSPVPGQGRGGPNSAEGRELPQLMQPSLGRSLLPHLLPQPLDTLLV